MRGCRTPGRHRRLTGRCHRGGRGLPPPATARQADAHQGAVAAQQAREGRCHSKPRAMPEAKGVPTTAKPSIEPLAHKGSSTSSCTRETDSKRQAHSLAFHLQWCDGPQLGAWD
eukprot:11220398-Lingulodinium_polyedra.AAC.1